MTTLAPGTWSSPSDVGILTVPVNLLDGDARLRENLASRAGRLRDAGRACVAILGRDAAPSRDGAAARARLARAAVETLGPDGADVWLTGHDPLATARAAAGTDRTGDVLVALHHVLLGHGAAVEALRESGAAVVGTGIHLEVTRPADPSATGDLDAALDLDLLTNHVVLGPLLDGSYPVAALAASGLPTWGHVRPGDLIAVRRRLDVLMVEHAGTRTVRRTEAGGTDLVHRAATAHGRQIDPAGLYEVLAALDNAYLGVPLLAAVATGPGTVGAGDGLAAHEVAAREAAADGADVRGLLALDGAAETAAQDGAGVPAVVRRP